ncbi:MAG: type II secretion system protein, partial [Candidatus Margulisiibacteriota bacterium]
MKEKKIKQNGFTLLEIIVTLGLMAMTISAIAQLYQTYLRLTADEKFKITAASLANQKIEIVRNLPYNNIGTLGGIPAGTIPQEETVTRNGYNFNVRTEIIYIDDTFDGTFEPGEVANPYNIDNPEVIYFWNLGSTNNNQTPQKGSGTITTSASLNATSGVVNQALQFTPSNATDYTRFDIGTNLDTTKGRVGFWYSPNSKNESKDRHLFYLTGCTGQFNLIRKNSNKLEFTYG